MKNINFYSVLFFLLFCAATHAQQNLVSGNALQKDSLIADLQLLEQALTELHPGLYRYNTPEDISATFKQLKGKIHEGISEAEFMKMLAQTIVKIRCGHTYINPWNMKKDIRGRLFGGQIFIPIGFKVIEGKMILVHNVSEHAGLKRGASILSINGIPTSTILDSLYTIAKTDGNNTAPMEDYLSLEDYNVRSWQAFDLYFPLFFPLNDPSYTITYQNYGESDVLKANVAALTKKARAEKMETKYSAKVMDNSKWSLDLSHPDLAIMRLGTFAIWNWKDFDQQEWFRTAFDTIQQLGITHLAIDIRGNGGGLTEPRIELTSYLIKEQITCDKGRKSLIRMTKINPDLLPYIDTWNQYLIKGLPQNFYAVYNDLYYELTIEEECQDIMPKKQKFEGEVFLFGGPSNVSATFTLIEQANQFGFAKVIGDLSGGNRQGINGGEYAFFYMPYSGMEVDIPLKYFKPSGEQPDAGVAPQKTIKLTQKDIALDNDPFIEYVKSQL